MPTVLYWSFSTSEAHTQFTNLQVKSSLDIPLADVLQRLGAIVWNTKNPEFLYHLPSSD